MRRNLCASILLGACAEEDARRPGPGETAQAESASTDGGRLDTATAAFLGLFEPPADTVRVRGATALRLWDRLSVAEAPGFDPLREMNVAATRWEQVGGDRVQLDGPSSLDATAHVPAVAGPATFVFRLTMRNSSGERTVELPVIARP